MKLVKVIILGLLFSFVTLWLIFVFWPLEPLWSGMSFSRAVYDQHGKLLRLTLSNDGKYRLWQPLSKISPVMLEATLLEEDQYFYRHPGINPVSLLKALWHTYIIHTRRLGGSTISMQVARLRYHLYSHAMGGKLLQIFRALQLECHYTKREILEAYINLAPYGNNVEGAGAASLIYFNQSANQLNLPEALTLAVIPQNPVKRINDLQQLKKSRMRLFKHWYELHPNDHHFELIMNLPIKLKKLPPAFLAPHFVNQVLNETSDKEILSSLDLNFQELIEHQVKRYLLRKESINIKNAAVLVLDSRDMEVKALVGSANFFNLSIGGQINATNIKRSPGSTLKPFIYALAIEQGLIHPDTVLKDVPHSFGNYNPENFDNDFMGPIKAKDALTLSRNIPAVYLADQLQHPSLYEFLQLAQIRDLKSESYYGLSLVLGGAEITMQELVGLYAIFANQGWWRPISFISKNQNKLENKKSDDYFINQYEKNKKSIKLISPEASFLVFNILKETSAPRGYALLNLQDVAWKTGTSSGYRDAWTIGIVGPYVLAVWLGNVDNTGDPALVGKEVAAPLFFDIAVKLNLKNSIHQNEFMQQAHHLHLKKVEVCKVSGMLPSHYCSDTEAVWFIPGKSPIKTDTIHQEIAINPKTGLRTCQFDAKTQFKIYEFWPSDLLMILKRAGIKHQLPPAFDETCYHTFHIPQNNQRGMSPQIISPQKEYDIVYRFNKNKPTFVPFTAVVDADVKNIHWFVNQTYLGKTPREQSFLWQAKPGRFTIRAVDDLGRADAHEVKVVVEQ